VHSFSVQASCLKPSFGLLIPVLSLSLVACSGAGAQQSPSHDITGPTQEAQEPEPPEESPHENPDPLGADAAQLASDLGISVEEAKSALEGSRTLGAWVKPSKSAVLTLLVGSSSTTCPSIRSLCWLVPVAPAK